MMKTFNVKTHSRCCAFCKYWYDPANSAIAPKNIVGGFWEFDDKVWNVCKNFGTKQRAGGSCPKYECKV